MKTTGKNLKKATASILTAVALFMTFSAIETNKASAADHFGEFVEAGFPPSYAHSLAALKAKYPSWRFEALDISALNPAYTFSYVLAKQTEKADTNLVPPNEKYSAYRKSGSGAVYDGGWYSASSDAVAHFLNPRNFLDEVHIFMFEDISSPMALGEAERIAKGVLAGTFMENMVLENGKSVPRYLAEIGAELGVAAPFLAARIRLEQGAKPSPLSSGNCGDILLNYYRNKTYSDERGLVLTPSRYITDGELLAYNGLYNFFNIGASGTGLFEIYENAMKTAKKGSPSMAGAWGSAAWNADYKGIYGGALELKRKYVNDYQNTLYLQKFNVDPRSSRNFWGQYMQNLLGAYLESESVAKAYAGVGATHSAFTFLIPVYSGMSGDELYYMCDINRSGAVNSTDAELYCSYLTGDGTLSGKRFSSLDVNGDGRCDNRDLVAILRYN